MSFVRHAHALANRDRETPFGRNDDGTYVVEYRDGQPDRHFGTVVEDMRSAHALVTGWAQGRAEWRESATWRPLSV